MPVVTPANNFLFGLHRQTNEATVGTVADYSFPVYSSDTGPEYESNRVEVTDAASIEADPYKGPTSQRASFEVPAFDNALGTSLQALWPTDTATGTAPSRVHTFSGLGTTQSWMSYYTRWVPSPSLDQTFGKGQCSGITFAIGPEGGPLRVTNTFVGQETTVAAWTATTAAVLADGWLGMQYSGADIRVDFDTPNVVPTVVVTNFRSLSLSVGRTATPEPTADSVQVSRISQGKVVNTGSIEMLFDSWDAYRASYFGSVGGSAVSATIVYGALQLNFKHSVSATSLLGIYVPRVQFKVGIPVPNPDGSALVHSVELIIAKPTTGDHVQPTLTNNVTPAY